MSTPVREPIYSALWNLVTADANVQATFATMSRYTQHFDNVDASAMPALYMLQKREQRFRQGMGVPIKRTLEVHFLCYSFTADPEAALPSSAINTLLDALDAAIAPMNGSYNQTLGGLVHDCWLGEDILMAEGLLQEKSITVVPVYIIIP